MPLGFSFNFMLLILSQISALTLKYDFHTTEHINRIIKKNSQQYKEHTHKHTNILTSNQISIHPYHAYLKRNQQQNITHFIIRRDKFFFIYLNLF